MIGSINPYAYDVFNKLFTFCQKYSSQICIQFVAHRKNINQNWAHYNVLYAMGFTLTFLCKLEDVPKKKYPPHTHTKQESAELDDL